ncbi:LacI family transcriptional regulator [Tessaracoccus sp. OS52]|uniref:LacI family DNA-binding transcriptional regulator n=1 Tax=Tessaracoccus sp. OS52 TaxID=2886691 RepID=UPI001D104310|nr:LacI family DNA-binding transcriptional regulator [Tessaracoccus sp. OS52]MCC2593910.1 LacI family transcriptional regulator [Tessaracoccus sp. OS52]
MDDVAESAVAELRHGARKQVTIADVARAAGVATSTVSRALSNPGRVSVGTARMVWQTADRLGYRGGTVRPARRSTSTRVIAVSSFDLAHAYYMHTIASIQRAATALGWDIIVVDAHRNPKAERKSVERVIPVVDAVVLTSPRMSDEAVLAIAKQRPTVVVSRHVRGVPSIEPDSATGMAMVVEHLADLGHRSITWLAGPRNSRINDIRRQAIEMECRSRGILMRRTPSQTGTMEGGRLASQAWLDQRTTAVIAYNDDMAVGFMQTLKGLGVKVPDEVSVVGIDNQPLAEIVVPGLTSLGLTGGSIGQKAMDRIVTLTEDDADAEVDDVHFMPMQLAVRDSTGKAPRTA